MAEELGVICADADELSTPSFDVIFHDYVTVVIDLLAIVSYDISPIDIFD